MWASFDSARLNCFLLTAVASFAWLVQYYSLVSLAPEVLAITTGVHNVVLFVTYSLLAFVIPIAYPLVLLFLWVAPLPLYYQEKMHQASRIISAWGAMEVGYAICV